MSTAAASPVPIPQNLPLPSRIVNIRTLEDGTVHLWLADRSVVVIDPLGMQHLPSQVCHVCAGWGYETFKYTPGTCRNCHGQGSVPVHKPRIVR